MSRMDGYIASHLLLTGHLDQVFGSARWRL
jgi:hypothetical protein